MWRSTSLQLTRAVRPIDFSGADEDWQEWKNPAQTVHGKECPSMPNDVHVTTLRGRERNIARGTRDSASKCWSVTARLNIHHVHPFLRLYQTARPSSPRVPPPEARPRKRSKQCTAGACMQMCFDTTRDNSGSAEKSHKNTCGERRSQGSTVTCLSLAQNSLNIAHVGSLT